MLIINKADFHHASGFAPNGHLLGVDFSGIVEEIGSECKNSDLKKGDRVFGLCHGGNTVSIPSSSHHHHVTRLTHRRMTLKTVHLQNLSKFVMVSWRKSQTTFHSR